MQQNLRDLFATKCFGLRAYSMESGRSSLKFGYFIFFLGDGLSKYVEVSQLYSYFNKLY